jgi:gas vesicle protein
MSAKNYWFAFGIGVTAGATIALLYAPQKGTVTRKKLRRSVDEASDYLEDAADYLKEQAERLSKEAETIIKRTRSQVESVVDTASSSMAGAVKTAKNLL